MALGSSIAVIALMTGQWPLLAVIAVIPVSEAVSDVLQIGYFKLTKGRRIFKMAPLHLHFELLGWSETQVVQRFWLIGLLAAMVGVGLAIGVGWDKKWRIGEESVWSFSEQPVRVLLWHATWPGTAPRSL